MRHLLRKFLPLLCIFFLSVSFNLYAADDNTLNSRLQTANELYSGGKYNEAITSYRSMIADFGFSAEILHNLANSYAADGQYGLAVLNYVRGLRVSPGDDDLLGDLEMTRKNIGLFTEEKNFMEKVIHFFDFNQWCLLALGGYVFLTFLVVLYYLLKNFRTALALFLTTIVFICICFAGAMQQFALWSGGVIIKPDVRLLLSPFPSASARGIVNEGSIVVPEKRHGQYIYIHDQNGRSGWVDAEAYRQINTSNITYSQSGAEQ